MIKELYGKNVFISEFERLPQLFVLKGYEIQMGSYIVIHPFIHLFNIVFCSPELKAQVSFSDRLSSVVCLSVRLSVCSSVCKRFLFSTSSQEPLGQYQPNVAQSILGCRGFKLFSKEGL